MQAMTIKTWRTWVRDDFFTFVGEPPDVGDVIEVTNGQEVITVRVEWADAKCTTHQIEASEVEAAA